MDRKKILVTGAASGIGRAVTTRFAGEGYDVCMNDLQSGKLEALISELPKGNHIVLPGSYAENETIMKMKCVLVKSFCFISKKND